MGISVVDILMLLVYYGVDVVIIDEDYVIVIGVVIGMVVFEQYLGSGYVVIVSINVEMIWGQFVEEIDSVGNLWFDYVVVVIGVDIENGIVYFNDSGIFMGCDEQILMEIFVEVWVISYDFMVVII